MRNIFFVVSLSSCTSAMVFPDRTISSIWILSLISSTSVGCYSSIILKWVSFVHPNMTDGQFTPNNTPVKLAFADASNTIPT